ncbi:MAG: nuclear transport factor 2 family protein [Deltaproteobacteria bacterium]
MRALALALSCGALVSCGGGAKPAPAAPKQGPAVDEGTAEKDAKGLLNEIYSTIEHADTDGLMSLFGERLVVYGPRKGDALMTRADALVALKSYVDPKKRKPALHSDQLTIVASPGGHSAWAFDVVQVGGQPLAMTAVLSNADDVWQLSAATLGATPTMKTVRSELKKDAVVPTGMAGVAKVDPSAKAAVDKLEKGFTAQAAWGDDLASRSDAVVIGPGNGDITRGKADIKKLFAKRVDAHVRATAAGQVTAATTADGQLAWVTVPVVQFEDDTDPLPLRVFAVFEKTEADWKMIALQESLAVDEPGQGAKFKTVVAPPLPKPPEAAPAPAADDKPVHKNKKKKKKKKPATDDDNG